MDDIQNLQEEHISKTKQLAVLQSLQRMKKC